MKGKSGWWKEAIYNISVKKKHREIDAVGFCDAAEGRVMAELLQENGVPAVTLSLLKHTRSIGDSPPPWKSWMNNTHTCTRIHIHTHTHLSLTIELCSIHQRFSEKPWLPALCWLIQAPTVNHLHSFSLHLSVCLSYVPPSGQMHPETLFRSAEVFSAQQPSGKYLGHFQVSPWMFCGMQ